MKLVTASVFVSTSFVTPLDYSVVNVGLVASYQPAVMMYNVERIVA